MSPSHLRLYSRRVLVAGALVPATVQVDGPRISTVEPGPRPAHDQDLLDLGDDVLAPGLIDLHIHGAAGHSFEEAGDAEAIRAILHHLARVGVTSVFASLPSAAIPETVQRTSDLHGFRDHPVQGGAELLGVHLEGPYLAAAQCGAHDPALLSTPAPQDIDHLTSLRPAMVTLAPELPGALAAVERFARVGTIVAAGHSEATGEDLRAAVARGLSHVTHLWSGQTQTTRQGPWRVPGLLEESLVADGLTAEVIADGRHLPPPLLEIARRCVGENLIVVSDATAGAGMPAGYQFSLSAVDCVVRDGVGMVVGQDSFGGSTTTLPGMLLHLHRDLGWPLAEVLALMTERPAGIAGVTGRKGRITAGADADLVVLDPDLNARLVTVGGEIVPGVDTAPT